LCPFCFVKVFKLISLYYIIVILLYLYLVKNINCKCMPYFLVTDKMINCKYNYNLKDIYNDLKIKYPRQLCDIKEPPSICNIKLLK
jgi:hypothetical protein